MPIVPIELDLESNPGRYGPDGGGRLINGYPEFAGEKGKTRYPIYPIEGLASFATLSGGGRARGGINLGDHGYLVSGTVLFKIDGDGNATNVGSFPGSGPVFMARNRKATPQIMLVSDGLRYILESDTLTSIADTDLPSAISVDFLGGYFGAFLEDGRWFISGLEEGTTWDPLDFATAESSPDEGRVIKARGREFVLFGSASIEFWPLTGAADFPFEANTGAFINNLGCMCRHSVKDLNDVLFFVASDGTVRRLNGYTPERISHHAVERDISAVADKDEITATAYSYRGHAFYNLSSDTWTWAYDGLTGLWHERKSYGEDRWRGEVFININGKPIVGDFATGLAHRVDADTYDEAGEHLVWTTRSAPIQTYPSGLIFNVLYVDMIPGTGLNSTDEHKADPKVMLRTSKDGGRTWSNERSKSVGRIGETRKRIVFERLGEFGSEGAIVELSMSAPVKRGLTGLYADIDQVPA